MRPVFAALVLLALSVPAHSAVVRYVYFDQNGRDLRIETIIDKWWADRVDEVAYVPAGTPISNRTGTNTLEPTSWRLPVDLTFKLQTPSPDRTARLCEHAGQAWQSVDAHADAHSAAQRSKVPTSAPLQPPPSADCLLAPLLPLSLPLPALPCHAVFRVQPVGAVSLTTTRAIPVKDCAGQPTSACATCGASSYQLQAVTAAFEYGTFAQPANIASVAYQASLKAATGFQASITWDTTYPRNVLGNSSVPYLSAWTAYLTGAMRDTGKVIVDALPGLYSFTSPLFPEGEAPAALRCAVLCAALRCAVCCAALRCAVCCAVLL